MHSYCHAAIAAIVLGSSLVGQGMRPGAPSAHAASPLIDRIFAVVGGNQVYTSADTGRSWQEADAGLAYGDPNIWVTSLAAAPDGHTVYASTYDTRPGNSGAGIFVSTNDGRSWHDDNGGDPTLSNGGIRSVVVSPANGQVIYAATSNGVVGRSDDGGAHWQVNKVSPDISEIAAFAIDGGRPSTLLAGPQDGLLISNDAGAHWHSPSQNIAGTVSSLAASPTEPEVIYAGTSNRLYQTIDGGTTWQEQPLGLPGKTEGVRSIGAIAVDPLHSTRVVAGVNETIYRSFNGGTTWTAVSPAIGHRITALLYDPARPGTLFAGTHDGRLLRSTDQGATWRSLRTFDWSVDSLAISVHASSLTDAVDRPATGLKGVQYFAQTGHTLRGTFYDFYRSYGDLNVFGLPLTEAFTDHGQLVQYFERARLALTAQGVGESPLGSLVTAGRSFPAAAPFLSSASSLYFAGTRHSLTGRFLDFWTRHHGQLLFGAPISQPLPEQNGDGTGRSYMVQYFQNARLEYHPELAGTDNEVQIGLIGRQYLAKLGLL